MNSVSHRKENLRVFEVQHLENLRAFEIKVWSGIFGPDGLERITH
jgi:hypothetical protein